MMWRKYAACKGMPVDLFMPGRGEISKIKEAKKVCESCPVLKACRDESIRLAQDVDLDGIYGGWTKNQRRREMMSMGLSVRRFGYTTTPMPTMTREVRKIHGTETAYLRHIANGETPCEECVDGHQKMLRRKAEWARAKKYAS